MAFCDIPAHSTTDCPMMDVICPLAKDGCKWQGKLKDRGAHRNLRCRFVMEVCGYPRCNPRPPDFCKVKLLRKDRPKHLLESCGYSQIDCPLKCGMRTLFCFFFVF